MKTDRSLAIGGLALLLAVLMTDSVLASERSLQTNSARVTDATRLAALLHSDRAPAVGSGLAIGGAPPLTYAKADQSKKKVRTNYNQPRAKKKSYCGYPQEPNPAGMSDYCSYMYNIYCRRGVGCSIYGREY